MSGAKNAFTAVLLALLCVAFALDGGAVLAFEEFATIFGYTPGETLKDSEIRNTTPNDQGLALFEVITPRQPSNLYSNCYLSIMPSQKRVVQVIAVKVFEDAALANLFFMERKRVLEERHGPGQMVNPGRLDWDQGEESLVLFNYPQIQGFYTVVLVHQNDKLVEMAQAVYNWDFR